MLTFALYYLIKNPEAMLKARKEVDDVLGDQQIQLTDVSKLKYIEGKKYSGFIRYVFTSAVLQLSCGRRCGCIQLPPCELSRPPTT